MYNALERVAAALHRYHQRDIDINMMFRSHSPPIMGLFAYCDVHLLTRRIEVTAMLRPRLIAIGLVSILLLQPAAEAGAGFFSQTTDPNIQWQVKDGSLYLQNNYSYAIRVKYTYCNDSLSSNPCFGPEYTPWIFSGHSQIVVAPPLPVQQVSRVVATVFDRSH